MATLGFNFAQAEYINIQLLPKLSNARDNTVTMLLKLFKKNCLFSFLSRDIFLNFFFSFFSEYFGSGVNCLVQQFETVWTIINKFPTEYVYLISQALITVDFDFMFVYYVGYLGAWTNQTKNQKKLSNLDFLCALFLLCDCCFSIWHALICIILWLLCM